MPNRLRGSSNEQSYATVTPLDPDYDPEIVLLRHKRFFGDGGLCYRFEKLGDPLVEFSSLANWLVSSGLDRSAVMARFRFSVRHDGAFWQHDATRRVRRLLDLISCESTPRGRDRLRPRSLEAEMVPDLMCARASVWVEWLKRENWPVPIGLTPTNSDGVEALSKDQPSEKLPISKRALTEYLEAKKEKGGLAPAADSLLPDVREQYPRHHVTRDDVRQVHREVFGRLPPGRRRKNG